MEAVLSEALRGGVRAIQLRERDLPVQEFLQMAKRLRSLTAKFGAKLLINDRVDVCLAVGADGVHLRADSLPIPAVRKLLGSERLMGQSTHSLSEVIEAQRGGADFVVLGPIYDTASKQSAGKPLGPSEIRSAASGASTPILAIGGIRFERIREVIQSGAKGIAVISAILGAPNVRESAERMVQELQIQRSLTTGART